jgi:hypothetical protein
MVTLLKVTHRPLKGLNRSTGSYRVLAFIMYLYQAVVVEIAVRYFVSSRTNLWYQSSTNYLATYYPLLRRFYFI